MEAGNILGLAAHAAPGSQLPHGGVISASPSQLFSSSADLVLKGRVLSKEGKIHRLAFPTHTSHPTPKSDQQPELLFSSCRRLPPADSCRPPPGRGPGAGTAPHRPRSPRQVKAGMEQHILPGTPGEAQPALLLSVHRFIMTWSCCSVSDSGRNPSCDKNAAF